MRQQNFSYGKDAPSYVSVAKKDFPMHNSSEAMDNLARSKLNGVELRKSHFMFGSDPANIAKPALPSHSAGIVGKTETKAETTRPVPLAKRTNVDIKYSGLSGVESGFEYETVTGLQQAAVKSDKNDPKARQQTLEQVKEMKQELRSAHFHFGNHEPTYESTAKGTLVDHNVQAVKQLAAEVSTKMQSVSFNIGNEQKRDLKNASTTYGQTISDQTA